MVSFVECGENTYFLGFIMKKTENLNMQVCYTYDAWWAREIMIKSHNSEIPQSCGRTRGRDEKGHKVVNTERKRIHEPRLQRTSCEPNLGSRLKSNIQIWQMEAQSSHGRKVGGAPLKLLVHAGS